MRRDKANALDNGVAERLARRLGGPVAGIDEAGRGPWAGPVVAAAVVLGPRWPEGLGDSKRLSPARRTALYPEILAAAEVGIGLAEVAEIDRLNIVNASELAMERAYAGLGAVGAVVDGPRLPPWLYGRGEAVVGGDGRVAAVAAASIVAKVWRDAHMVALAEAHPGYGWERNKGYGTREHRAALDAFGVSPHHRLSFRPISQTLHERIHLK